MRYLEDIAHKKTIIHKLHPVIKLVTTFIYLTIIVSFDKYEITGLFPLILFPVIMTAAAEIPVFPLIKRLIYIEPLIIGIGILNPLFDNKIISIYGLSISSGWIVFISIVLKSSLTVTSAIILMATTGIDKIALSLRSLKIPKIFVLQILLTYRYISILIEEAGRTMKAYSIRSFENKGIQKKAWGSLLGGLVIRTYDRAQRIYEAMCIRGFSGEYNTGGIFKLSLSDILFLIFWTLFFIVSRLVNLPLLLGLLITGA